jgi:hypothetical protein
MRSQRAPRATITHLLDALVLVFHSMLCATCPAVASDDNKSNCIRTDAGCAVETERLTFLR